MSSWSSGRLLAQAACLSKTDVVMGWEYFAGSLTRATYGKVPLSRPSAFNPSSHNNLLTPTWRRNWLMRRLRLPIVAAVFYGSELPNISS